MYGHDDDEVQPSGLIELSDGKRLRMACQLLYAVLDAAAEVFDRHAPRPLANDHDDPWCRLRSAVSYSAGELARFADPKRECLPDSLLHDTRPPPPKGSLSAEVAKGRRKA